MAKQTFTTGQVLTAAQMTSLQQTAMLGGAASAKTASYTLIAADAGTAISMNSASATTITVNTALFAAGDTVQITNLGAGVCTITAGTATVNTASSLALAQYESGTLNFTSASAAIFIKGDGAAASSGGMTLISTTTLNAATITLSSIPQIYTNLLINISGVTSSGGSSMRMKINSDTTSTSVVFVAGGGQDQISTFMTDTYFPFTARAMDAGDANNVSTIIFNQYASTTGHKSTNFNAQCFSSTPARFAYVGAGSFASNSAITSLEFFMTNAAAFLTGTVLLYGVK